jgi:signal transduction histidine kinase
MRQPFLNRFTDNFRYLSTASKEGYQKKIFRNLVMIALVFTIFRMVMVDFNKEMDLSLTIKLINASSLIVIIITLLLFRKNYQLSRVFGLYLLPLSCTVICLYNNEHSIQYLLLIFLIVAFIIYDSLTDIILCFIWNSILYSTIQISILNMFETGSHLKDIAYGMSDGVLFLMITFFLLTYLKNTVNFYVKRMENDNDTLMEINTDLINMHKELVVKNKKLEKDHFDIHSNHKALSKILSVISHDIKSPLISVRNIIDYTMELKEKKENVIQYMPEISNTLNKTVGMLENLLEWSRNQSNQEEQKEEFLNFNVLVSEMLELYSLPIKTKHLKIEIENPTNAIVGFNKQMFMTVLRNLLSNAVKFTKIGGQIKLIALPVNGKVKIQIINEVDDITQETIDKLNREVDVLQNGTAGETGSGFGLVITRDFLNANHSGLQFSQKNNKLVICEFTIKGYLQSKLKAIGSQELSVYRLSVK